MKGELGEKREEGRRAGATPWGGKLKTGGRWWGEGRGEILEGGVNRKMMMEE